MINGYYVYRHIRPDKNEVFYVGKGRNRRNAYSYERARTRISRNKIWQAIVNKCSGKYDLEIVMEFNSAEKCVEKEKELIAIYGRKDVGLGTLANLTDGGDGSWGLQTTEETRRKRRVLASRPRSQAWVEAVRRARKNGGNGGVVKKGDRLPSEWKKNIGKAKIGKLNPMFGKTGSASIVARKVIDIKTNTVYASVQIAADMNGFKMKTLYNWLSGHRQNRTSLRFL